MTPVRNAEVIGFSTLGQEVDDPALTVLGNSSKALPGLSRIESRWTIICPCHRALVRRSVVPAHLCQFAPPTRVKTKNLVCQTDRQAV
jgi:hypothetical protein